MKLPFALILFLVIKSRYNFAHVTAAQLPWHVQSCNVIWWLSSNLKERLFSQYFNYDLMGTWSSWPLDIEYNRKSWWPPAQGLKKLRLQTEGGLCMCDAFAGKLLLCSTTGPMYLRVYALLPLGYACWYTGGYRLLQSIRQWLLTKTDLRRSIVMMTPLEIASLGYSIMSVSGKAEILVIAPVALTTVNSYLPLGKMVTILQTILQMHFREWKVSYFDSNFTEVCS